MNGKSKVLLYSALPMLILVACVLRTAPATAQMTSVGVDCSKIYELGILKQDNMRAGRVLIECGVAQGGQRTDGDAESEPVLPPNVKVSNRACTSPSACTKSENMIANSTKNPKVMVTNYNDHNVGQYSGTSYSLNGGTSWTEINPPPFANGHGTNYGDPIVVFNDKLNKWFAGDLATGCGGQGIGLWTSPDAKTWTVGACAHNGGGDDRESMWVDNDPTSAKYGRMYVSWNDYANNAALSVAYSDDGTTWKGPVILNSSFVRDVQLTGAPKGTRVGGTINTVFVAAMDEGGGGFATRQNIMYRSLDGGVTWTSAIMGPRFQPVGEGSCDNPYFVKVNPIIRHMGWGEPGVGPAGVVHYAYAGKGKGTGDTGDIYYTRSIDNGVHWSVPRKLNDDKTIRTQWMPSLSVTSTGRVTVSWYDRRQATGACNVATDPNCSYARYAAQSKTNGATFLANIAISPVEPQPQQQDTGVQACYAGDYDYDTAQGTTANVTWTDGRVAVGGIHVQNVEYAPVPEQ